MKTIPPSDTTWADTFAYVPPVVNGRAIDVEDGDTITIATYLEDERIYRFTVQLCGVDCPRKGSKVESERRVAGMAQSAIQEMILGSVVQLQDVSCVDHGRISAAVSTCCGVNLSQWLLARRFAVPYDGVVHTTPKCWMVYHLTGSWDGDEKKVHLGIEMLSKIRTDCGI
jgi:endonuclease YncB( thermonuclease family)